MSELIECQLCGRNDFKSVHSLSSHIVFRHKMILKEYYDNYIRKKSEGICIECSNITKFIGLRKGYNNFCGPVCSVSNITTQSKMKQTCLKHLGVEHASQSKVIQEIYKQTSLLNWGFENPLQSKVVQEKSRQSCLEIYGVDNVFKSEKIKEIIKKTNLKNLGFENPSQSEVVKKKRVKTSRRKFGKDNYSQTVEGRLLHRNNFLDRLQKQFLNGEKIKPRESFNEKICLNELQNYTQYKIERNPRIIGYFPDGYIKEIKLLIEYDESHHYTKNWTILSEHDQTREQDLKQELNCKIFRIKDKEWLNNREIIIDQFKNQIQELNLCTVK